MVTFSGNPEIGKYMTSATIYKSAQDRSAYKNELYRDFALIHQDNLPGAVGGASINYRNEKIQNRYKSASQALETRS